MDEFLIEQIRSAINRCSRENASNTPDFILAQYLDACLLAFETATQQRETWYGRDAGPTATAPHPVPAPTSGKRCIDGSIMPDDGSCPHCHAFNGEDCKVKGSPR